MPGFRVPEHAIDAQSLIALADLVISAGGTMNREAVALGTPVYTTFSGRMGAVDERLIAEGRMGRLEQAGELSFAARRPGPSRAVSGGTRGCCWICCSARSGRCPATRARSPPSPLQS